MATRPARFCDTTDCRELITGSPDHTTCMLCNGDACSTHRQRQELARIPHLRLEVTLTLCTACHKFFTDKLWGTTPPNAVAETFQNQLKPQLMEHLKAAYAAAALTKADK